MQYRLDYRQAPRRVRLEELGATAGLVPEHELEPTAVQVRAAGDDPSAFRHRELRVLRVRREHRPVARYAENRIGLAVAYVEPDRFYRRQRLARHVMDRVLHVHGLGRVAVVHEHVDHSPVVGAAVRIAVAGRERDRRPLLSFRVEPLGEGGERVAVVVRERLARVVRRADPGQNDMVEHDVRDRLLDAVCVRDRGADPDDVAVEGRRRNELRALHDSVRPDGDRGVRMKRQRLLAGMSDAGHRKAAQTGEEEDPAHRGECSRG